MAIVCKNLTVGYHEGIIKDISFTINNGDFISIVGENGVGKSTLIKTILNLITPISGTIELSDGLKRSDIGYLPQQSESQKDFPASVMEIVLSGLLTKNKKRIFFTKKDKETARNNLNKLGILSLEKKNFSELSGGQRQRVLLARTLSSLSKLLVLDEPVAGLDPDASNEFYNVINVLNKDGITVVMISHDIKQVIKYSNKIMHVGSDFFFGATSEYLASPIGKLYLSTIGGNHEWFFWKNGLLS